MIHKLLHSILWLIAAFLLLFGVIHAPPAPMPFPEASPRLRAARPKGARHGTSLAKRRAWYANVQSYGFWKLEDLAAERVTAVGVDVVNQAVFDSTELYQREVDQLLANVVERVTWYKRRFTLPSAGTLQPLDEHGNPIPIVPTGNYEVALPIQGGGIAWGDNRVTRAKMTVAEADRFTSTMLQADADWMIRHILAAWFANVTWTYPDEEFGNLTVQPLANGDTVEYVLRNGTVATDNHFAGQAAAIDNSNNPFPTLYNELVEHPSNRGPFVAYIPTNVKTAVEGLTAFVPVEDPDIRASANSDTLIGSLGQGFGDEVLGKANNMWIVQWDRLPDNYITYAALGATVAPFAMREHSEAELQGLFPEFQDVDGNRHLNKFIRYAGFGALNRVAAGAYEVADATYDVPTAYVAPLPV